MKILLIIKNFDFGGTEVNVCQLANALCSRGHEVHIASNRGRQIQKLNDEVIHHVFKFTELRFIPNYLRLLGLVKKHRIVLVHGHQRMAISLSALLLKRSGIPAVGTVHGQFIRDVRSKFIRKLLSQIIIVAPNRLNGVNVDTKTRKKIKVIYNSIPMPHREVTKKPGNRIKFMCVSRIDSRHGSFLEKLICEVMPVILKTHDNIDLEVVGDGSYLGRITERLAESSEELQNCVTLAGYQSNPVEMMREASVVLGVGRVAIEALSVNTPVISVNALFCGGLITAGNYEIMKSNNFVARHAEKFSVQTLISCLTDFIENKQEVQEEHLELSDCARVDFSSEKMLDEITALYENLMESK